MAKLTKSQLLIVNRASRRTDWAVIPPPDLRGAELKRALVSLVRAGLLKQVPAVKGMPTWRLDRAKGRVTLFVSHAGLRAAGIKPADPQRFAESAGPNPAAFLTGIGNRSGSAYAGACRAKLAPPRKAPPSSKVALRSSPKQATFLKLIARKNGAAMDELAGATGWQHHSIRAAISRLRRQGHPIELRPSGRGGSRYFRQGRKDRKPRRRKRAPPGFGDQLADLSCPMPSRGLRAE
jgi:Protein of unknown function (DUF3489)